MGIFTESKASLIGINGKFTPDFTSKITEMKNSLEIDHNCYSGSSYENLCEYAGRICYKSGLYGKKNRPSKEYHEHIRKSEHHSIYGHSMLTFKFRDFLDFSNFCVYFAGVPGWYPSREKHGNYITINFRFMENMSNKISSEWETLFHYLYAFFLKKAPAIFRDLEAKSNAIYNIDLLDDVSKIDGVHTWYTFEIVTSRRIAQELTRHGFQSAISMESSRYVPLLNNGLIVHPMINQLLHNEDFIKLKQSTDSLYRVIEESVYQQLKNSGEDLSFSKKQARGAATGTQMLSQACTIIYSCSKIELKTQIFRQRLNNSADLEINHLVGLMKKNFQ